MKYVCTLFGIFAGLCLAAGDFAAFLESASPATVIVIDQPMEVAAAVTIPAGVTVNFQNNGKLIRQAEGALIVRGAIQAPPGRIFENFDDGQVNFSESSQLEVYPQWWGARGDGRHDDSAALQAAIRSGTRRVAVPPGRYLVTRTLNGTDLNSPPLTISGAGNGLNSNCKLLAQTGGVLLDVTGSPNITIESLTIQGDGPTASTTGILFARSENNKFVEFSQLRDLTIQLPPLPEANHGVGTIGIYLIATELWRANNIVVIADNAVVMTATDLYNIQSAATKFFTEYTSTSQIAIDGASSLIGRHGPALTVANLAGLSVNDVYFNRWDGDENSYPFAVKVIGMVHRFNLTGHLEGYRRLLNVQGIVEDMNLHFTAWRVNAADLSWIELNGTTGNVAAIRNSRITAKSYNSADDQPHPLISSRGDHIGGLSDCEIQLYRRQSLEVDGGRITGNVIKADFAAPNLKLTPSEGLLSYQLFDTRGITFAGPVFTTSTAAASPAGSQPAAAKTPDLFGGTPSQ